jgi:hypothetical protein
MAKTVGLIGTILSIVVALWQAALWMGVIKQ